MRRDLILVILGVVAGLVMVGAVFFLRPYALRGSVIEPAVSAPDFTLHQAQGGDFRLSEQQGKLVLIFFGYTSCPDVCPTTLGILKQVRERLGSSADQVQVVMVTVDPERDTPQKLAGYMTVFDPAFIGLTGTEAELEPAWQAYGVYHKANKKSPDDTLYEVEHSAQVYLVDQAGKLRLTYAYGTPVDDILQDVRYLLKSGSQGGIQEDAGTQEGGIQEDAK